jgi:hypothetical protein
MCEPRRYSRAVPAEVSAEGADRAPLFRLHRSTCTFVKVALLSVVLPQNMQCHARRTPALQNFILVMSAVGQW